MFLRRFFSSCLFVRFFFFFCLAGIGLTPCPPARTSLSASLSFLRASAIESHLLVPLWALVSTSHFRCGQILPLVLMAVFFFSFPDCAHSPDDVLNSPSVQRSVRRWKADISRTSNLPVQEVASPTRRHLLANGLPICTWNTCSLLLVSAASSQRPRENKLKYLKRIAEKSDILCLQETHGRIERFVNFDMVLDRATWMKISTFTPGNVNSGGSVYLDSE